MSADSQAAHPAVPAVPVVASDRGPLWWLSTLLFSGFLGLCAFVLYFLPAVMGAPLESASAARSAHEARLKLSGREAVQQSAQPPLQTWLTVACARVLNAATSDPHALARAAQLGAGMCAALAVFLTALFGSTLFSRATGVGAALILSACEALVRGAQAGQSVALLTLANVIATGAAAKLLLSANSPLWCVITALGLATGLAVGGIQALLWLGLALVIFSVIERRRIRAASLGWLAGAVLLSVAMLVPFWGMNALQNPISLLERLNAQVAETPTIFASGHGAVPVVGIIAVLAHACAGLLPFTPMLVLLPLVLLQSSNRIPADATEHRDPSKPRVAIFFMLYTFAGLLTLQGGAFTVAALFPAYALAIGALVSSLSFPGGLREEVAGWLQLAVGLAVTALLAVAGLSGEFARALSHSPALGRIAELAPTLDVWGVPLAVCALVFTVVFMRQWVAGRGILALVTVAILAASLHLIQTVRPETRRRHEAFRKNVEELREPIAAFPQTVPLYAVGRNATVLSYYLDRPVQPLDDAIHGSAPETDLALLISPDDASRLLREFNIHVDVPGSNPGLVLAHLRRDDPGLMKLRAEMKQ